MGKKDYHLTTDLADRAIDNITSHVSAFLPVLGAQRHALAASGAAALH
jgi:hypothetical protein